MVKVRGRRILEDLKVCVEKDALRVTFVFRDDVSEAWAKQWIRAVVDSLGVELELAGYPHVKDIFGSLSRFGPRRKRRVFTRRGSVLTAAA
jgi:hypothetical protein